MTADQTRVGSYDAIVVGGGHNGLTAAAYLARAGLSTLVVERRGIVGGACVTEEIAPGCRASTTSYIASMLRPEVIRDLDLAGHGLKMVPCDPALLVPFADGTVAPWWSDRERTVRELAKLSPADARTFVRVDDELKRLARYLQPFFLEPPPDVHTRGFAGVMEALRVGRRFSGISGDEIARMVSFMTGSLGDFLDRNYESEKVKALFLANNVYGKHGGPYSPGTALGLLFHLLSGGEHDLQGFYGHVMGGMGAITQAMASAARKFGAEIRTSSPVGADPGAQRPRDRRGARGRHGDLREGRGLQRRSQAHVPRPRRARSSCPRTSAARSPASRWTGPARRSTSCCPKSRASTACRASSRSRSARSSRSFPRSSSPSGATTSPSSGEIPEELWVDCVVASNVDPSLAPEGRHVMTCFIQYVPYR